MLTHVTALNTASQTSCRPPVQGQLDLFDPNRWPRKPYCSEDKSARHIRSLKTAITRPYIQANPPKLRIWSIYDVDRPCAGLAWEDANLPPPAWSAINRQNGHAHLVWGLEAPVLVDSPDMRQAPLRYLCAVESAFRAQLDADAGYSGLITKNPAHPFWDVLRGPRIAYELDELAEWVDLDRHKLKLGAKIAEIGVGRNVTLFDATRQYAYGAVLGYKDRSSNWVLWFDEVRNWALKRNGDFRQPLDPREVWHIAKSVSRWTWREFNRAGRSAWAAARGRAGGVASGKARRAASEDKRVSARLMHTQGLSTREIARVLDVHQSSVVRWLADTRLGGDA